MHRTGLIVALSVTAVAALAFGVFPALDLGIAGLFYPVHDAGGNMFAWRLSPVLSTAHDIALNAGFVMVAPALIALVLKLIMPRMRMLISGRAIVFLVSTMLIAPGLVTNVVLKDYWGRPRPIDVTQFGGQQHFVPWWDPRGDCPNNCSFVSGDVSTAAWAFAPAALAPPQYRALAYGAAFALTAFMAVIRIMAGAHFTSDTILAGTFTFLIIWLAYALIYRWRTRLDDKRIEAGLERISLVRWLTAR
ncbi:MAG: phosphatase PAP2 family protein [Pseudolabrys sp.]